MTDQSRFSATGPRTILFADVSGSTRIIEAAGDVAGRAFIAGILGDVSDITERFRGEVVKTIGDEVMASFGEPLEAIVAAVHMQREVRLREALGDTPPRIKIGLHAGSVIVDRQELYGDAVEVASHAVSLAKADQILTTQATIAVLAKVAIPTRSLGAHDVIGREEPLEIREILWEANPDQLTTLGSQRGEAAPQQRLEVTLDTTILEVHAGTVSVHSLGRGEENAFVVPDTSASRFHADIIARGGRFYLADHSTNGTFVRPRGGVEMFVHRDEVQLGGEGTIRLGRAASDPDGPTLRYRII